MAKYLDYGTQCFSLSATSGGIDISRPADVYMGTASIVDRPIRSQATNWQTVGQAHHLWECQYCGCEHHMDELKCDGCGSSRRSSIKASV